MALIAVLNMKPDNMCRLLRNLTIKSMIYGMEVVRFAEQCVPITRK